MSPTAISDRRRTARPGHDAEGGFTLAALLVLLTIIMVFVAYTVPPMWSRVLKRDRDLQTLFIMKQYARSIAAFKASHNNTVPVSLDQLKEARNPRLVRGVNAEWPDPLTGKVDWILIPPSAIQQGATVGGSGNPAEPNWNPNPTNPAYGGNGGNAGNTGNANGTATTNTNPAQQAQPNASPKDYVGPFVGVRPNREGPSYLVVKGSDRYEDWLYTTQDLQDEVNAATLGIPTPGTTQLPIGGSGIEAGPPKTP